MVDLTHPSFPLASSYDADWLLSLDMGPNPLWLLEDLLSDVVVRPGDRVLDLGSGRGATSVFLAKERGVEVWALDLWVDVATAEETFAEAGVGDSVTAVQADARQPLPFQNGAFDAIISVDAWEYVGTDDHFLPSLLRVLRSGGAIGVATPSMTPDVRDIGAIPDHIGQVVGWEAMAWHSPEWWKLQWELTGLLDNISARSQPSGWSDWLRWTLASDQTSPAESPVAQMLKADEGRLLSFALVSGTKR